MAYLNVAPYNTNSAFNFVNVCNKVNDYAGFGSECLGNSAYLARFRGVKTVHNGNTEHWVAFFADQNSTSPMTWTASAISNFNSSFEGVSLNPPANMVSPIPLIPYTVNDTASYNGYYSVVPDFSNITYVSYNDWSSWNASTENVFITTIPMVDEVPDDPTGDTPSSDYSQISNAIYSLGAVIIVVCFFSMIYKIFHRLRG